MLILNADDFGYSSTVNQAILTAFREKLCSCTTMMANMPGFAEACDIARTNHLELKTGIHFVLTEGTALSQGIRSCPRFCSPDGALIWNRHFHLWQLSAVEQKAILEELQAQLERCRNAGLPLTHADSHNHVHEEWALLPLFMQICRINRIPWLRLTRNCGKSTGWARQGYRYLVNLRLKNAGLARTRLFGSLQDYCWQLQQNPAIVNYDAEIMLHPDFDPQGNLIDHWEKRLLREAIGSLPDFHSDFTP